MRLLLPVERVAVRVGDLRRVDDVLCVLDGDAPLPPELAPEAVPGVSAMALRRATRLGNAAVAIAHELLAPCEERSSVSVITTSALGELQTNDALIEGVVGGGGVSPQKFSASVHNHVLGQVCIHLGLACPGGASTGGHGALEVGMVEALGELAAGGRVLLLAFEPRVEAHYAPWWGGTAPEHVVGILLEADATPGLALLREAHLPRDEHAGASLDPSRPHALRWLSLVAGRVDRFDGVDGWCWHRVAR